MLKSLIFNTFGLIKAPLNTIYSWSSGNTTYSDGANTSNDRNKTRAVTPKSIMEEMPKWSRWQEVQYCRYLTKNWSIPQSVFSDITTYTIGGGAIAEFHGGDSEWQRNQEEAFAVYAKTCSADRRDSLVDLAQICLWGLLRDGEIFPVFTFRDGASDLEREPILQICETHVFKDTGMSPSPLGYIDGVKYNDAGEAMEYITQSGEKINGASVLHICEPRRAGELRCSPMWAGEINPGFDSKELALLAGTGFKNQLVIPVVIDRPPGSAQNPLLGPKNATLSTADDAGAMQRFENVTGVRIYENKTPGGGVHMSKPEYPGALYAGFQETYARSFCSAVYAWPFDFTNLTNKNGTTQRTVLEKATRISENIQRKRLDPLLIRTAQQWLAWRIKTGQTPAVDNWWKVSFRYPRAATIDMGRDTTSDALELSKGMQSIPEYFARYQQDWRVEFTKNAEALGITFDQYRRLWIAQHFGEEALARLDGIQTTDDVSQVKETPVESGQMQPTAITLNGAQVTSLADLLAQVAAGTLPFETGKAMVKTAFPEVSDAQVDMMFNPLKNFTPPGSKEINAKPLQ